NYCRGTCTIDVTRLIGRCNDPCNSHIYFSPDLCQLFQPDSPLSSYTHRRAYQTKCRSTDAPAWFRHASYLLQPCHFLVPDSRLRLVLALVCSLDALADRITAHRHTQSRDPAALMHSPLHLRLHWLSQRPT